MNYSDFIRQGLNVQGLPVYETDIPFINSVLSTINQAESVFEQFPTLNNEVPITVVDKGLMR